MPIIIPSKHIYGIESNSKLLKNKIDKIDYSQSIVNTVVEEANVYNTSVNSGFSEDKSQQGINNHWNEYQSSDWWVVAFANVEQIPIYYSGTIAIQKNLKEYFINNVSEDVHYTVYNDIYRQEITGKALAYYQVFLGTSVDIKEITLYATNLISSCRLFEDSIKTISKTETFISDTVTAVVAATAELQYEDTISNIYIANEDDKNYYINITILCGMINTTFGGHGQKQGFNALWAESLSFSLNGEKIEYRPVQINFSVKGEKITIDVKEENLSIGLGKNLYNYEEANELIQSTNMPTLNTRLQKIIDKWKDGREIAVLECGIDDYYDENGNQVKSINNGDIFRLHEQVIPYIYQGIGLPEEPMSIKKNGEPKVFEIIGREITYEGAPLQKITILEV